MYIYCFYNRPILTYYSTRNENKKEKIKKNVKINMNYICIYI